MINCSIPLILIGIQTIGRIMDGGTYLNFIREISWDYLSADKRDASKRKTSKQHTTRGS